MSERKTHPSGPHAELFPAERGPEAPRAGGEGSRIVAVVVVAVGPSRDVDDLLALLLKEAAERVLELALGGAAGRLVGASWLRRGGADGEGRGRYGEASGWQGRGEVHGRRWTLWESCESAGETEVGEGRGGREEERTEGCWTSLEVALQSSLSTFCASLKQLSESEWWFEDRSRRRRPSSSPPRPLLPRHVLRASVRVQGTARLAAEQTSQAPAQRCAVLAPSSSSRPRLAQPARVRRAQRQAERLGAAQSLEQAACETAAAAGALLGSLELPASHRPPRLRSLCASSRSRLALLVAPPRSHDKALRSSAERSACRSLRA